MPPNDHPTKCEKCGIATSDPHATPEDMHCLGVSRLQKNLAGADEALKLERDAAKLPLAMLLWCPSCGERHVDRGDWVTRSHHTHACQNCGMCWRPAVPATVGVQFLPGFRDDVSRPLGT